MSNAEEIMLHWYLEKVSCTWLVVIGMAKLDWVIQRQQKTTDSFMMLQLY